MSSNFKTWVCSELIRLAKLYDDYFVKNVYLIASPHFIRRRYYIISASERNFLHLTGVSTKLDAYSFYVKCLYGTLTNDDFDYYPIVSCGHNKNDVKDKLHNLNSSIGMFSSSSLFFQEGYIKNSISCAFITSEGSFTMGFVFSNGLLLPKTILSKNQTDSSSISSEYVILKMSKQSTQFDYVVSGTKKQIFEYCSDISYMVSKKII